MLGQALRADGGRLSRIAAGDASASQLRQPAVTERSKVPVVVACVASRAEGKTPPSPLAALSGAVWSQEFQAQRGFDIMFQVLKVGPIVGPLIYPALLDLCFLPDAASVLVAGSSEDMPTDGASETPDHTRRALGLECNISRVVGRSRSGSGWFLSALDPPPQSALAQRCGIQVRWMQCLMHGFLVTSLLRLQSCGAVGLILRLVPHMRASTAARALGDIASMLKVRRSPPKTPLDRTATPFFAAQTVDNAAAAVMHLQDWGSLVFRALMFLTPSRFPECRDLLPIFPDVADVPHDSLHPSSVAEGESQTPVAATAAPSQPSEAAQHAVDDAYASGEAILVVLARAALHVNNGWTAYQRLLALQPAQRFTSADVGVEAARAAASHGGSRNATEWSVAPIALTGRALQGRRLLALALAGALRESYSTRRSRHTVANLLALTALLDREFTSRWPSGTRNTRRAGAATPAGEESRSRGGSSMSLSILARGKEAVLRSMSSQLRRPPSAVEGGAATQRSLASARADSGEPEGDAPPTPVDLTGDDATKTSAAAATDPPPPLSFSAELAPEVLPPGDPESRFDGALARLVLVAWDDLLVPSPDEAERYLAMSCEALPSSGSLLHMLMSLSVWTLRVYPVDHPVVLAALARMQRLQLVLFSDLRMMALTPAGVAEQSFASAPAPSSSVQTPFPDGKPPRSGRPPTGRDAGGIGASMPTRIASFLQSGTRERGASVVSSGGGGEDDWEEVEQLGRPGVATESWLCYVLSRLHSLFLRLRDDVLATRSERHAGAAPSHGLRDSHFAVAELGVALLKDLVQVR